MYLSPQKRAALADANRVRTALGYAPKEKLAKGIPGSPSFCPIARTINEGLYVSVGGIISVGGKEFPLSTGAIGFISSFDNGSKHQGLRL